MKIYEAIEMSVDAILAEPQETFRKLGRDKSRQLMVKLSMLGVEFADALKETEFARLIESGKIVTGKIIPGGESDD